MRNPGRAAYASSPALRETVAPPAGEALPLPVTIGTVSGWVHGTGARGVLMCGASGFEGAAAYQSWRILADLIAARGYTVLRFDYPNEGDSGDVPEPRAEAAVAAIRAVNAWLTNLTGTAPDVVSLRLGSLLATNALAGSKAPQRHAMLAPITSGRSYLREMKAAARLFAATPGRETTLVTEGITLCGHALTEADCRSIEALGWSATPSRLLTVLPDGLAAPALCENAEHLDFPGYAAMMSPAEAMPPMVAFNTIAGWFQASPERNTQPLPPTSPIHGPDFVETRLRFGPDDRLAGTWCEPPGGAATVVILPNAGANARFGWARMAVDLARLLAQHGVASLRLDLTGIGDSTWSAAGPRASVYALAHDDDIDSAIRLAQVHGATRIILAGLCSGGYLALRAGDRNAAVSSVIAANVLKLTWRHGVDDLDTIERTSNQASRVYGAQALSTSAWKRLLTGEIAPQRVLAVAGLFAGRFARALAARVGYDGLVPEDARKARAMLQRLARRGVAVNFVHSALDASRDEIDRLFGSDGRFLAALGNCSTDIIPESDHEFSPKNARDRFGKLLLDRALKA
ncbi:MAG: alpha/beta hydrolase [Proteobacteria bacterium]|nr:alpha/beta hydrolase [Pseudomonadota bacterium]